MPLTKKSLVSSSDGNGTPASNVVKVFSESDFGTIVPATRIDVTPDTTFKLMKPITQTLPFLIGAGDSMEIKTTSRIVNTLTYTNSRTSLR